MANLKLPKTEPDIQFKVIEIDRALSAADWTKEDAAALKTLNGHPGHNAEIKKIRLQRAFLETTLRTQKFETLAEFSNAQGWAQALKWVENQVKEVAETKEPTPRDPYELEEEAFASIARAIKIVGN